MKDRYRKELAVLRRRSRVVESCVGAQDWESVDLDGMPARCRLLFGQPLGKIYTSLRTIYAMILCDIT